MPINPRPDPSGNIIKTGNRIEGLEEIHVIGSNDELTGGETRFTSHFATCENAAAHRR
jgi:hypothetical protein